MSHPSSQPAVVLKAGRENSVRRRHPWIFSGAIAERIGAPAAGTFIQVRASNGAVVGAGHWGTKGIAVRMLAFEPAVDERALVSESIRSAVLLRSRLGLGGDSSTTGFRVVNAEGDGLPGLVVDRYADVAVAQFHSAGMWRLRDVIREILMESSSGLSDVLFRKVDAQVDDDAEVEPSDEASDSAPRIVTFLENGLTFSADLLNGQKTGFFLDQRISRQRIRELAKGRHVLNAFCYTGAFSVYALAGEAKSVVSVDASKAAIEQCEQNVAANFPQGRHEALAADCFSYLPELSEEFDLVVLDPPAFVKHRRALQRGLKGYETINAHVLRRIRPGGIVATFSCSQLVSTQEFELVVAKAASAAKRRVRIIERFRQAPCHPVSIFHPEGEYLKGLALYVE